MTRLQGLLASLVVAAACLPVPALAGDAKDLTLYFRAAITIEPDGSLSRLEWQDGDKIPAALRTKLDEQVLSWTFEPGKIDGRATETESTLRLRLLARAVGDAVELQVERADTGPSMKGVVPPEYPREALRSGSEGQVLAALVVEPDGTHQVTIAGFQGDERHRGVFLDAVESALRRVEVQHEEVGGIEVAARFAIPMSFCLNAGCDMEFSPEADRGSSLPTTAPGQPRPQDSVARLVTDVQGTSI